MSDELSCFSQLYPGREKDKFNFIVQLDPESKVNLAWWNSLNRKNLSTPVILPIPSVTIESDASSKGWGAVLEELTQTGGVWTAEEAINHQLSTIPSSLPCN